MSAHPSLLDKLGGLGYTAEACTRMAAQLDRIRELKRQRRAVVLAHNYQRPEIFEVADAIGDSLALSRRAGEIEGEVILFAGVHFMAETAKILNPGRTVLLPNLAAGCSLADTATAEGLEARVTELRTRYPDLAVVSYVNTTADVKALSDVCCTSANAVEIVNALPNNHILFVPDKNLAAHVQKHSDKMVIAWDGNCYVHQQITPAAVANMKALHPEAKVIVHPECRPDVVDLADAVLSTEGMVKYAKESPAQHFIVVTECGLSDRLFLELPEKVFYRACQLCRYMKANRLEDLIDSLEKLQFEIVIPEPVRVRAEAAVRRMLAMSAAAPRTPAAPLRVPPAAGLPALAA
jgi:quinolinate synthase